jgi:O-antigen/teichoic acid export membrane protein
MTSSFLSAAIIQVVTMMAGILSARLLLPQGKGELTAVMLWPSILASIGSLGVIEAATYFTADAPDQSPRIWATTLALVAGLSLVLVAIGYFLIPEVLAGYGVHVVAIARWYLAFIPLSFVTLSLMGFLLGRLHFIQYNVLRVLGHTTTVVLMVALYAVGRVSVYTFAVASLVSGAITAVVAGAMVFQRQTWMAWTPDVGMLQRLLRYGIRSHAGTVASVLNLRLDQMLMSVFLDPSTLGLYVVAVTVSAAGALGANTIGLVAFPSIANARTADARRQALARYSRLTLLLSVLAAVVLFWQAPRIVRLFFGRDFVQAVSMARVLIVATVPLGCNVILAAGLKAFNRPAIASYAEVVSLAVTAIALGVLLPAYKGLGAAWASLAAYSATSAFLLWRFNRELRMSPADLYWRGRDAWTYILAPLAAAREQFLSAVK